MTSQVTDPPVWARPDERSERRPDLPRSNRERVADWIGALVSWAGAWSIIAFLLRDPAPIRWISELFNILAVPAQPNLFVAAVLIVLGSALRRRLVVAWWLLLVYLAAALVLAGVVFAQWASFAPDPRVEAIFGTDITKPLFIAEVVGAIAMAAVLIAVRRAFVARLAPGSWVAAVGVIVGGLAASLALTTLLTVIFPRSLQGLEEKFQWALWRSTGITIEPLANFPLHVGHPWIGVVGAALSVGALYGGVSVFLRTSRARQFMSAADEFAIRGLLNAHGEHDSLGYFATRRDKSVVFSPDGRAAVTYRVVASMSVASADPIGDRASWPAAIDAWQRTAREKGWFPAVLSASEDGAEAYVEAGLRAIEIGDEAIIEVADFALEGRAMRQVRQAVTRVQRAGYTAQIRRHADVSPTDMAELIELAEAWRDGATERGFSMAIGRLGDPADDTCLVVTVRDSEGAIRGLLSFVPWGRNGLSLDLMRRDRHAPNGLNEFMVVSLLLHAPQMGVRRISLNFAMFRSTFSDADRVGAGPITRLTRTVLSAAGRFWQLESLYRSNAKYRPEWVPRFLCYESSLTMTRTMIAAGMAEGFLPAGKVPTQAPITANVEYAGESLPFAVAVREQTRSSIDEPYVRRRIGEQQRVREAKLQVLQDAGVDPYPVSVPRTHPLAAVRSEYGQCAADVATGTVVSVAGRITARREFGQLIFAMIEEEATRLQVMLDGGVCGAAALSLWARAVDIGDVVSVTGEVVTSRHGELSILAHEWQMASKCLHPLPSRRGLSDPEVRLRNRHLDLMLNDDARSVLIARTRAIAAIRDVFAQRDFLEVETPVLQTVHGGAAARPFRTHINAYNTDLYLRIAPELFLKRLCVAGMSRVFEVSRNFRNEGVDATHNPEFTALEAYQAYADYETMRHLARELILASAVAIHGAPVALRLNGNGERERVQLDIDWPVVPVYTAVGDALGMSVSPGTPTDEIRQAAREKGIDLATDASRGAMVTKLYDDLVEKQTVFPTFYTDFPLEASPLARPHRSTEGLAERWDLVAFGCEIGTAYSELIDPLDQRQRLVAQSVLAAGGDLEAMQVDEAFLTAMEYAMPPTGGLGIGLDRLVMLLTGGNIRSTLAFPFVRPEPRH